ncbi:MAG: sulfatase [Lentisphaeraceae bacterium]|nr:sulfatase [Lentisphaeraceae bacterium]
MKNYLSLLIFLLLSSLVGAAEKKNILLITVDDMNWDSIGAYGCKVKGTTPNIDRLAAQSFRFEQAHVNIAVCQPCRNTLNSARYPHRNIHGFQTMQPNKYPTLPHILKQNGYRVGILGKVEHSSPYFGFEWNMEHDYVELGNGRDPEKYFAYVEKFFGDTKKAAKPFYMMVNAHDPHRPFHINNPKNNFPKPSKVYTPEEIVVPGFLPDIPKVRLEISEYYSSVRRADDVVGRVLQALKDSGQQDNTVVVFLSDHGIAVPFAKTNCYYHSTKTPLMVKWPGVTKAAQIDKQHLVGTIDFMPTILEGLGLPIPAGIDGRSYYPVLKGEQQAGREKLYTEFHETAGANRFTMRGIVTKDHVYIFNPWSDGRRKFRNESMKGRTFKAMVQEAKNYDVVKQRVELFARRVVEEFYEIGNDPDALKNLISSSAHQGKIDSLRNDLQAHLIATKDPAAQALQMRKDPEALKKFMQDEQQRSKEVNAADPKAKKKKKKKKKK